MKATVTPEAANAIADIAQRHGLSQEAVLAMLVALREGGGTMAQFNVPELGGNGQWMRGGMTMVGNMFDNALKARVDALCNELSQLLTTTAVFPAPARARRPRVCSARTTGGRAIWGPQLGRRAERRALRILSGHSTARDPDQRGDKGFRHRRAHIGGVQQQQGTGYSSVGFTSQFGTFGVSSLRELGTQQVAHTAAAAPGPQHESQYQSGPAPHFPPEAPAPEASAPEPPAAKPATGASDDAGNSQAIVAAIESLAGLHQRGILSDEEFSTKKAELLSRL